MEAARKAAVAGERAVSLREYVGHSDRLRAEWDGMAVSRRQAVIGAILDRVTIGPGVRGRARFDDGPGHADLEVLSLPRRGAVKAAAGARRAWP